MWFHDRPDDKEYYRFAVNKGSDELVLSVQGAKKIATVMRFDQLLDNVIQEGTSPDKTEREREMQRLLILKTKPSELLTSNVSWKSRLE